MREVNVLNTIYKIIFKDMDKDEKLTDLEGYTDMYKKEIVVCNLESREYFKDEDKSKLKKIENKILRHELIHAFLHESGLDCNSSKCYNWAENEEMVDWFAIQSPKIMRVFKELKIDE